VAPAPPVAPSEVLLPTVPGGDQTDTRTQLAVALRDPRVGTDPIASADAIMAICDALTTHAELGERLFGRVGLIGEAATELLRPRVHDRDVGAARLVLLGRATPSVGGRLTLGDEAVTGAIVEIIHQFVEHTLRRTTFSVLPPEEQLVAARSLALILYGYTGRSCEPALLVAAMVVVPEDWRWDADEANTKARCFVRVLHALGLTPNSVQAFKQRLQKSGLLRRDLLVTRAEAESNR
jgi:hypothetical protein